MTGDNRIARINDFHEYIITDVLAVLGDRLSSRRMFGGYGLYLDGKIFGMITSDSDLYFKVGDNNREDYEQRGSEPFVYTGHKTKGATTMPYWKVPEEVIDNQELIAKWAEKAVENSQ